MANIFDGLDKLDNNAIIDNISILEALSMGNVMKGYGTTIANKGAKVINGVGKIFGKNLGVTEVKEKRIQDYIKEKKLEIKYLQRSELDKRLISILSEKTNIASSESKDMISVKVVDAVADSLGVRGELTTAQKSDAIHIRYYEKILSTMQEDLIKQNNEEAEKTSYEIEKNINKLTDKEKEELKKLLNIETLEGKEIRKILMKAGTPTLIISALSASGFGAFMGLTTIIHAVFTTILGITLPFAVYTSATSMLSVILGPIGLLFAAGTATWQFSKGNKKLSNEVMGQVIFSAVNAYGGSFTVRDENLPSYEKDQKLLKIIEERDLEYNNLVKENEKIKNKLKESKFEYSILKSTVENYKKKIISESEKRANSKKEISALKVEKNIIAKKLEDSIKRRGFLEEKLGREKDEMLKQKLEEERKRNIEYKDELDRLNTNIKYQNNVIDEASIIILEKEKEIEEYELKNIQLEKENEKYSQKISIQDKKIKDKEDQRRKEIEAKWNVFFTKFNIKTRAIRDTVKFSKKEIWEIERALMELYFKDDFKSLSRGKIKDGNTEYEHMGVVLPCGFPTRILYKINSNSLKRVDIVRIYKHNEKFYQ